MLSSISSSALKHRTIFGAASDRQIYLDMAINIIIIIVI